MENGKSAPIGIRVSNQDREAILWKAREDHSSISGVVYEMLQAGGLPELVKDFSMEQPEGEEDNV